MVPRLAVLIALTGLVSACGEAGEQAANVVQAASKAAGETVQQAAEHLDLARLTPEVAMAKVQELVDRAAEEFSEVEDSAAVERVARELEPVLESLAQLRQSIAPKLNLAELQQTVQELIEKFKDDPRVRATLKLLQEQLQQLVR